jgi:hypothetical protein
MQTNGSVIHFPKQSKSAANTPKQKPEKKKCTVLEWLRSGYRFPHETTPLPKDRRKP